MANSADLDQLASSEADLDLHCLQRQGISGFSRTRVNIKTTNLYVSFMNFGNTFCIKGNILANLIFYIFKTLAY